MADYQIPRNSLIWMLTAQAVVIAPHVTRLVPWITAVCLCCGLWRVMIFLGRWSYPGRVVKFALVFAGMIAVPVGYGRRFYGLEPAVALLILAFFLKLLEMHQKRDAYIVIYLAYFVALTEFLFSQTIPVTLYLGFALTVITAAMIGLNQTRGHLKPGHTFRLSGSLLAQSLPMMVVLFVLFPRIGPLWSVPLQANVARTGVSDTMSYGDIVELSMSDELAFRATFDGEPPVRSQLYWRGLVFSEFDGETWRQARTGRGQQPVQWVGDPAPPWDALIERRGDVVSYEIMLEATQQNWVFALATPVPETEGIGLVRDFRLYSRTPIQSRLRYRVTSYLDHVTERRLSDYQYYRMTRLPESGNPRARLLAERMYTAAGSPREYVMAVLTMFNQQEFVYTLKPELLSGDVVDGFLLDTQRGFCEHFAGSFVFMMRAAGIPSRVVVGYQGGEYNPVGNYLAIHQFDAHAWTEVWFEGTGWERVDPTSAVAPERIEDGLEAAVEDEASFLEDSPLSWLRYRQTLWLTEIRLQFSALKLFWDSWVVGYTPTLQMELLEGYFGEINYVKLGIALALGLVVLLLITGAVLLRKRVVKALDPVTREYLYFCHLLERLGYGRRTGEGPHDFAARVGTERPDLKGPIEEVTRIFVGLNYAGTPGGRAGDLKRAVRGFRLRTLAT